MLENARCRNASGVINAFSYRICSNVIFWKKISLHISVTDTIHFFVGYYVKAFKGGALNPAVNITVPATLEPGEEAILSDLEKFTYYR